jgi:hypothetical protein
MQNTGCGAAATLQNQNHACCAVIADLVSLVEARSEQLAAGRTDDRKRNFSGNFNCEPGEFH